MELDVPRTPGAARDAARARSTSQPSSRARTKRPSYSLFPPPEKPLPPPPPPVVVDKTRRSVPAAASVPLDNSRPRADSASHSSTATLDLDVSAYSFAAGPAPDRAPDWPGPAVPAAASASSLSSSSASALRLRLERLLVSDDRRHGNSVYFLDPCAMPRFMASKHGKDTVKIWRVDQGAVDGVVRFPAYTEAQSRSRDYLIRSHAVVSESSKLVAVATRFGRSLEIWDWKKRKCLHTITDVDRWTAGGSEGRGSHCSPLAVYRAATHSISLYSAGRDLKSWAAKPAIDLARANLPFVPQYPELTLSAASPLLVAAAGPRPPKAGHPPPEKETLLVAWEVHRDGAVSQKPYRVVRPWQHEGISTAVPYQLSVHGSVVVSIWIPAAFQAVPAPPARRGSGYNLAHVPVRNRHVLVWDLAGSCTWTFAIPNCLACISPDCRYVAYCHASGAEIGARGCLAILDVREGNEVWSWPDKDALAINSGPQPGFAQFEDLGGVSELCFSADGASLMVGDKSGRVGIYNIRDSCVPF